jgi:hypothetical protein
LGEARPQPPPALAGGVGDSSLTLYGDFGAAATVGTVMAEALGLKILDLALVAALDADTFHTT